VIRPGGPPFLRYVAIGDSSTEGLEDPAPDGGYRGWADRLAEHIADAQDEPLEYANLAIRGMRLGEIRSTQFDDALAMKPDLMTIFGGVNDVIAPGIDFAGVRDDYAAMFSEARGQDICVLTFTVPDLSGFNPFGRRLRGKLSRLNDIIRFEAERYDVLVMDFEQYPVAQDPRLWFEDRLHGNALGHEKVAAALAARLGIPGFDESWADPLEGELAVLGPAVSLVSDLDWAVHHLGPFLSKGIRGIRAGLGVTAKRPVPTVVAKTSSTVR
jgi:lysophospholipase L1-like esterase